MKATVINKFGDFDVLEYVDVPTPKPGPGHIVIKVLAAGVNRLEHYIREGSVAPELPFPHILGADAAGEVFRVGSLHLTPVPRHGQVRDPGTDARRAGRLRHGVRDYRRVRPSSSPLCVTS